MGIVADYINMMLHLDIIGFNIMLHAVREQTENIDRLVTIVGELDALIAAAGFRHSLPAWCVPKLTAAETVADGAAPVSYTHLDAGIRPEVAGNSEKNSGRAEDRFAGGRVCAVDGTFL